MCRLRPNRQIEDARGKKIRGATSNEQRVTVGSGFSRTGSSRLDAEPLSLEVEAFAREAEAVGGGVEFAAGRA